jgi:membrane-associated phospholipid phosphatase
LIHLAKRWEDAEMDFIQRQGALALPNTRSRTVDRGYRTFLVGELLVVLAALLLMLTVMLHRGPLPGEVGVTLGVQHALLHTLFAGPIELVSTIGWPIPAAVTIGVIAAVLLALRRWLDVLILIPMAVATSLSNLYTADFVQRPRPKGHGIWIEEHVKNYFSFPSGHVVVVTAIWGFVFFLTLQSRHRNAAWMWIPRILALVLVVTMPISRLLEGEHWLTDVAEGFIYGVFWLLLGIQVFRLGSRRFPKLLSADERAYPVMS